MSACSSKQSVKDKNDLTLIPRTTMETLAHLRQQPHSSKAYWPLSQHVGGSGHWCRLLQIYCDDDDQYDNDGINVGSDYQIAIVKEHEHWPLSQHVGGSGHWCRIA